MIPLQSAASMISDAVLNNLITTIGALLTAIVPTAAVIISGKRTRKQVRSDVHEVKDDVGHVRRELQQRSDVAAGIPAPIAGDVEQPKRPEREPRRRDR